jgi:hypothetical protein
MILDSLVLSRRVRVWIEVGNFRPSYYGGGRERDVLVPGLPPDATDFSCSDISQPICYHIQNSFDWLVVPLCGQSIAIYTCRSFGSAG